MGLYFFLYASIVAALASLVWVSVTRSRLVLGITIAFSILALLALGALSWAFRDGLGPDSVTSVGVEAWRRFLDGFWVALAGWCILVAVAFGLYWRGRARSRAP